MGVSEKLLFTDVLQNRCSKKFCNIHRKTPVLESLFNKVTGMKEISVWKFLAPNPVELKGHIIPLYIIQLQLMALAITYFYAFLVQVVAMYIQNSFNY